MISLSITGYNAYIKSMYREAINLTKQGWIVLVKDIPGYDSPPEIEGFIPDIYAIKSNSTYIVVVETKHNFNSERHQVLSQYASRFQDTSYQRWVFDSAGCRINIKELKAAE